MKTVNELLQNIRFLKFYGWGQCKPSSSKKETSLTLGSRISMVTKSSRFPRNRVAVARQGQHCGHFDFFHLVSSFIQLATTLNTQGINRVWIPSAMALSSFLCYTLIAGERLTVSKAFTSVALFSQLQTPMVALPGQFFAMLHGMLF